MIFYPHVLSLGTLHAKALSFDRAMMKLWVLMCDNWVSRICGVVAHNHNRAALLTIKEGIF